MHSSFDTPQTMPTINLVAAIVIAITLTRPANVAGPAARLKIDYRLLIAAILFAGVMAGWAWSLWSYAPFERGVTAANLGWQPGTSKRGIVTRLSGFCEKSWQPILT